MAMIDIFELVDGLVRTTGRSNNVPPVNSRSLQRDGSGFEAWIRSDVDKSIDGSLVGDFDALIEVCVRMAEGSRSDNTRRNYGAAVMHLHAFLTIVGVDVRRPTPQSVALFFGFLMKRGRQRPRLAGGEYEPLAHSTLLLYRSAIAQHYAPLGRPELTGNDYLKEMLAGYARTYGRGRKKCAPAFDLSELASVVEYLALPTAVSVRNAAITSMILGGSQGLTPNALTRLERWDQVEWPLADDGPMTLQGIAPRPVTVMPSKHLDANPIELLREWKDKSDSSEPIFEGRNGLPMTRQAMLKVAASQAREAGVAPPLHDLDGRVVRRVVLARLPHIAETQATAMLTVGLFAELRSAEVVALNWNDFEMTATGVLVSVRRSKTDQTSRGAVVHVSAMPTKPYCPVAALDRWRRTLGELASIDGDSAVFRNPRRLDRRLSAQGVNDTVKRVTAAAGLSDAFTSHSLRATVPTIALQNGYPAEALAQHGRRSSTSSLQTYYRPKDLASADPTAWL